MKTRSELRRLAVALLVLFTPGWGLAAETRLPVVGTRFAIMARTFAENLGSGRAALETEVARRMAALGAEELGYVEWRALTESPSADDPAWVLEGSMVAGSSSFFPAITLRFKRADAEAGAKPLIAEPLYRANDPEQPIQDAARLRDELLEKVQAAFSNSDNLAILQSQFLVRVPVARALEPNAHLKRVILPRRWGDLLPGEGSLFKAEYAVLEPDGSRVGVKLVLSPSVEVSEKVACSVTRFEYPPVSEATWHPLMPASVSNAIPDSIRVFISQYVKDYSYSPSTMDRLVVDPFGTPSAGGAR